MLASTHPCGPMISTEAHLLRSWLCAGELSRPVVIAGNGPSMSLLDQRHIPADALIFRTNFFFLEPEPTLGTRVDAYFWAVDQPALHRRLHAEVGGGRYEIRAFVSPLDLNRSDSDRWNPVFAAAFQPSFDHWSILAHEPRLARAMSMRPLPTSGLQMLATAAVLGFRDVHLAGIDFYQDLGVRYSYPIPADLRAELDSVHLTAGYEDAHSLETDLNFLDLILETFSELRVRLLTPLPLLEPRLERSGSGAP